MNFKKIVSSKVFTLTAIYIFTFLYMLPLRDQTFQDDWAYIQSVRYLHSTGELKISDWVAPTSIAPVAWVVFFTKLLGFSIKNIHLSTITLLYFGILAFYLLLRRLNLSSFRAFVFSTLLLGFPWVFQFSYTFITEIPFMSLLIVSLLFYTKGFQERQPVFLSLGSLFAGFAYLTRQLGLSIPLAVFLTVAYRSFVKKRIKLKEIIFALIPFLATFLAYSYWLTLPGNMTTAQYQIQKIFKEQTLPYLLPIQLAHAGRTFGYYASFIQRIPFYFHHLIGFLLPTFLIFKFNRRNYQKIKTKILAGKRGIMIAFGIYIFLMSIEILYHYHRRQYTLEVPSLVTRYFVFPPIDWRLWWKYFVILSIPIWIIIVGVFSTKVFKTVFKPKIKLPKNMKKLTLLWIVFLLLYQVAILKKQFQHRVPTHIKIPFNHKIRIYLNSIFSADGWDIVRHTWVVLFLPGILILTLFYLATRFRLTKKPISPESSILFLSFFIQFSTIVVLGYFHWAQYVISLIPYIILLLATMTKELDLNKTKAVVIVFFILAVSVSATKNRYYDYGTRWVLARELIEKHGVAPINIGFPDESWLPWWYYEETFKQAVKEDYGGDKYKIPPGQAAVWRKRVGANPVGGYSITKVPLNYSNNGLDILIDTGPIYYDIFTKTRYIVYRD